LPSTPECLTPCYEVWRQAAEIRHGWSQRTRANRRRQAKLLLRRIGLDESLLPPIEAQYLPGDRRYHPEPDQAESADDQLPIANPGLIQRSSVPCVRRRGTNNSS
jgi:hypothetical protein